MEDLDAARVKPGMSEQVLTDLRWLGLDWDGEVTYQSQRSQLYREALERLAEGGLTYPCTCTRSEIERAQTAPHGAELASRYPGTCRARYGDLDQARAESGRDAALRFLTVGIEVRFEDRLAGPQREDLERQAGDFPVARRDSQPAYHLAVVVDDADQGVSEVLRGDDLLASTARQAALQDALDLPRPAWVHVPLVTDGAGRRLAKRSDDLSLAALREAGVEAGRIVAWAAGSAGMECDASASPGDLSAAFDLERLPRDPVPVGSDLLAAWGAL